MCRVTLIAFERCVNGVTDNRVDELRGVVGRQRLHTNKPRGQGYCVLHLYAGDRRGVAQLASVPEHRERLG